MATKITETTELQLELSDDTGAYTRTLRIDNPDTETYVSKADVMDAIGSALFPKSSTASDASIVPLFYDDYDPSVGLTQLKSVQIVAVRKEVTELT